MITAAQRQRHDNLLVAHAKRGIIAKEAVEAYEKRIERHLLQSPQEFKFSGAESEVRQEGNVRLFGELLPRGPMLPGGVWLIEAPFTLFTSVVGGVIKEKFIVLRCWEDQKLDRSISLNLNVATLICEGKLKSDVKFDIVTVSVVMWLRLRGRFFWLAHEMDDCKDSRESMFYDATDHKLRKIASNDFRDWLYTHSGISPANDRLWKQVFEGIKAASTNPDISSGVVPGNLFDRRGNSFFVSCGPSKMVKVTKDGCEVLENGHENVVFPVGQTLAEWNLMAESDGLNPFDNLRVFNTANYASPHGKLLVEMWVLSLFSCIKNFPIILFQGRYRSGKTRCARAIFELLGIPVRLNSIQDDGQEDFWATINRDRVVGFDNVDGRVVKWFPNDIQIAATGGSKTKRKMYTDSETVTLESNAKIILTANDPKFMTDSGIADRVLNVELLPFDDLNGKTCEDEVLTDEIASMRSAALTWLCYTLSRALRDTDDVKTNINKRHPDFARFALRCERAVGRYDDAMAALAFAEFNKSYQPVVTDRVAQMIFEVIRMKLKEHSHYEFTSSEMLESIKLRFADQVDDDDRQLSNRVVGRVMMKHLSEFAACFKIEQPKIIKGITHYSFDGFTDYYSKIDSITPKNDEENANVEDVADSMFVA